MNETQLKNQLQTRIEQTLVVRFRRVTPLHLPEEPSFQAIASGTDDQGMDRIDIEIRTLRNIPSAEEDALVVALRSLPPDRLHLVLEAAGVVAAEVLEEIPQPQAVGQ